MRAAAPLPRSARGQNGVCLRPSAGRSAQAPSAAGQWEGAAGRTRARKEGAAGGAWGGRPLQVAAPRAVQVGGLRRTAAPRAAPREARPRRGREAPPTCSGSPGHAATLPASARAASPLGAEDVAQGSLAPPDLIRGLPSRHLCPVQLATSVPP